VNPLFFIEADSRLLSSPELDRQTSIDGFQAVRESGTRAKA
jgi:hypothetical protein